VRGRTPDRGGAAAPAADWSPTNLGRAEGAAAAES
jgi:hypothetical protein